MAENDSSSDSGKTDVVIEDVTAEATKNQNLEPIKNKAN